ncbi:MAG TPA: putative sporulation protein YtxC [Desulfitobacteriaceae bacterium]|jgi:putative sporulation protein YtxC|nr:putative sporulation protein YtxC [Desulfitobacteriaceae bacterium]
MPVENSVQLGTKNYKDSISARLRELRDQEALPFQIQEIQQGKYWLILCDFQSDEISEDKQTVFKIQRYYLANALTETILLNWEEDYVRKSLGRKYNLNQDECLALLPQVLQYLNGDLGYSSKLYRERRKASLLTKILACLEDNSFFDVEGFLRFRAQNYKLEVDKAIAYTVDEYIMQKEYVEFIELLKHFLDTQTPRIDTLHVVISSEGKFHLFNDQAEKVTGQFLDNISFSDKSESELSYEDLLISSLIAVAPRQVVLHICFDGYRDTLQTVRKVFKDRISYCSGCAICDKL